MYEFILILSMAYTALFNAIYIYMGEIAIEILKEKIL